MKQRVPNIATYGLKSADLVWRNTEILSAEVDGEVVALNVNKGLCYGLDPIGAVVWAKIVAPVEVEVLCAALVDEFDVDFETCKLDVIDLLENLYAEGLIAIGRGSAPQAT